MPEFPHPPPGQPQVWYVELQNPRALDHLSVWLDELTAQPGFLGAELLSSPEQPGLGLVASRWADHLPDLPLPTGARGWTFEIVASR